MGEGVGGLMLTFCRTDPDSPRLRDMVEKEYVEALRFSGDGAFERQAVYIRREEREG